MLLRINKHNIDGFADRSEGTCTYISLRCLLLCIIAFNVEHCSHLYYLNRWYVHMRESLALADAFLLLLQKRGWSVV